MRSKLLLLLLMNTLILSGCGGEATEDNPKINNSKTQATSLKTNPIPLGTDFSNFNVTQVTIDPNDYVFIGDKLYLKLYHHNDNILYLGEINRYNASVISVNIPTDINQLHFEIFTANTADQIIFGDIWL